MSHHRYTVQYMFTHLHRTIVNPPSGSHLIGEGSRPTLLFVASLVVAPLTVAALLAVVGLVTPLGAGVGVLLPVAFSVALLTEGVGCGGLFA